MVECPHALVQRIAEEDFRDPQEGTIKQTHSFPAHIHSCGETNATTIHTDHSNQLTSKMDFLHQAQANQTAHTIDLSFNKCVSASVRMRFATATMIVGNRGVHPKNEHFEMMTYCCKNCSWMK